MANVDITIRTIDQTNTKGIVGNFTEINSAIQIMRQGLEAVKRAYDFGRQGAQLSMLSQRFDRLSQSIGTTADALLKDLKTASRGLYSDFELIESSTNLVALGLAKDHDEAVRLTRVAAGLNMNMNQLVLTLTNMTTMRFDALGVSVDGFKDRMKGLETQGYDTNDAFKEAFLQQAEMQLERVGEAADTQLGSFMRLEAGLKNLSDAAKQAAANGLEPLVTALSNQVNAEVEASRAAKEHKDAIDIAKQAITDLTGQVNVSTAQASAFAHQIQLATEYDERWVSSLMNSKTAIEDVSFAVVDMTDSYKSFVGNLQTLQRIEDDYSTKNEELVNKQIELEGQLVGASGSKKDQIVSDLQEINQAMDENAAKHEESVNRFKFGILQEMLMVDGLSEQEGAFLTAQGVRWGVFSEEVAGDLQAIISEAQRLSGQETELASTTEVMAEAAAAAAAPIVTFTGEMTSLRNMVRSGKQEMTELKDRAESLNGIHSLITVDIQVNGSLPNIGPEYGSGGAARRGKGRGLGGWTEAFASGGKLKGGMWAAVGDAPGGAWTPYTELVTPNGFVLDAKTSKALKESGIVSIGGSFAMGGALEGDWITPTTSTSSGGGLSAHSAADVIADRGGIRREDSEGGTTSTKSGTVSSSAVASLANVVTDEVSRMGGTVAQSTVANVNATERQTAAQLAQSRETIDELRALRRDMRTYNESMVTRIVAEVQRSL